MKSSLRGKEREREEGGRKGGRGGERGERWGERERWGNNRSQFKASNKRLYLWDTGREGGREGQRETERERERESRRDKAGIVRSFVGAGADT